MIIINIGKKLKKLRQKKGYSQYRLSQKSGVSQSFISDIENGKKSPTIAILEKICVSLGISIVEFFSSEKKQIPEHLEPLIDEGRALTPEQSRYLVFF